MKFLERFPEYIEFKSRRREKEPGDRETETETPEEKILSGYGTIRQELADELLQKTKTCSPGFFEKMVIELLVKMGYGGSLEDAGEAVGGVSDEGIDGVIKEDKLGLDSIYIQAKRWEGTVSRPEIQKFAGALQGKQARKGIFITTSDFSKEASGFASKIDSSVILINGEQLAQLMIDFDVGVSKVESYVIKRIDSDYFEEELL